MRSLQATYLKFAEYIDILAQIIYAKLKNNNLLVQYWMLYCNFIEIRNKSETSLAIPLQSVRRGEFGCDGRFSGPNRILVALQLH